jgi:hypothetical protein
LTPGEKVDQQSSRKVIETFLASGADRPTLGLVYGRRRIGKSTLLQKIMAEKGGFYWEATRGESAVQMTRLGEALGRHFGIGRLSFHGWDDVREIIVGEYRLVHKVLGGTTIMLTIFRSSRLFPGRIEEL